MIQLALGAFISSLGVKRSTKLWKPLEHHQQFAENECTDSRKSHRLRKEGNSRFNKVSAMNPGLAKIIEKVHISRYFVNSETGNHKETNASLR